MSRGQLLILICACQMLECGPCVVESLGEMLIMT